MTDFTRHMWAAIPVAHADAANLLLASQGHGAGNFAVPLGAGDTVTHLGIRTVVRPPFEAWLEAVASGAMAIDGADLGTVTAAMSALSHQFATRDGPEDQGGAGWAAFLAAEGLQEVSLEG